MRTLKVPEGLRLTEGQRRTLQAALEFRKAYRVWPTCEELAEVLGRTRVTAYGHLRDLERRGVLKRTERHKSRALELLVPIELREEPDANDGPESTVPGLGGENATGKLPATRSPSWRPPHKVTLTRAQLRMVDAIRAYETKHRISPSRRELAERLGITVATVNDQVRALAQKGVLQVVRYHHRAIRLVEHLESGNGQEKNGAEPRGPSLPLHVATREEIAGIQRDLETLEKSIAVRLNALEERLAGVPSAATAATPAQFRVLEFVRNFMRYYGVSPTYEEIGRAFGIGGSTVHEHVSALEEKGFLRRAPNKTRSLELVQEEAAS